MNVKAKGYILGAVAAATYGMNPLFALPLYKAGMNPDSVLFFRYLFAIPVLGMMIVARGRSFKLKRKEVLPLIIMGLLVALSSLALFQSYNYMDVGIASTLLFVYPILVALIMWGAFKEKLTLPTVLCILLALGGIGLLYKSGDGSTLSLTGIILVMVSALSYAILYCRSEPVDPEEFSDTSVDFLRFTLWFGLIFGPGRFRTESSCGRYLVFVGKSGRFSYFSNGGFISLHYPGHTIYRLHPNSYPGSFRASDRRFLRCGRFR